MYNKKSQLFLKLILSENFTSREKFSSRLDNQKIDNIY